MTNDELKSMISDLIMDEDILNEMIVLEGDEFADGAIGITEDYHLVYSYDRLVESLSKHNNWTAEEAIEWLDYNTLRAIPYMARDGKEPIVLMYTFSDYAKDEGKTDGSEQGTATSDSV